jgi:cell division protein FtsI (penicillin-binding protein 3)
MNNNKKRIYIIENEDGFEFSEKKKIVSFNRVAFLFFFILFIFLLYSTKIVYLGSSSPNQTYQITKKTENYRADIVDIDGSFIAKSVITYNVGIKPNLINDKKKFLLKLKYSFPELDFQKIENNIEKKKFFYLKKKLTPQKSEEIKLLGEKSLILEPKITRIYPDNNLFSHTMGQIDDENFGVSGIEKSFDNYLKTNTEPLSLTLDKEIQFLVRQELLNSEKIFKNIGSASILMNINSGEILSLVSLPDFDINKRNNISDKKYINRVTKGVYEFGSVFKTFTIAAGFNEKLIEPNDMFNNLEKKIKCGGRTISEYDENLSQNLSVEEILINSGNIGSVKIGQKLGIDKIRNFLNQIGILGDIKFDITEIGTPIPFNWGKCKLLTVSFGHGITTTLLQLAKGYAIISNGGFNITPTLVKNISFEKRKRVLSRDVSFKINQILRRVVTEGTASLADVKGYEVGGKTGTALIVENGKYTKKKINTFASIFPTNEPKYVLIVMLEDTKLSKDYVYKYRNKPGSFVGTPFNTAGWTSVEVAAKIIERIGPILATKY